MQKQSNGFYDSDQLKMLLHVLEEVLAATISANGSPMSESYIEELASRSGRAVIDHFIAGETDPEMLKAVAIRSIQGDERSAGT